MKQVTKLSSKYQTTIPAQVRRALGLKPGDRLAFELGSPGDRVVVTVRRYPTIDELAGSIPVPSDVAGLSWRAIRERAWAPVVSDHHSDPPARR